MKTDQSENHDLPCVCGHSREEHKDPRYPGSTECSHEECDCIAYEADRESQQ